LFLAQFFEGFLSMVRHMAFRAVFDLFHGHKKKVYIVLVIVFDQESWMGFHGINC